MQYCPQQTAEITPHHHLAHFLLHYNTQKAKKKKKKAAFNIIYHDFEMWEKIQTKTIVWIKLSP